MTGRLVIMAGGTGGHVFPALAIAEEMQTRGWQISWLGTTIGLENKIVAEHGIEMDRLTVQGIRGKGLFSKLIAVFKFIQACFQALMYLLKRKPDLVIGMGGFVAAPGGFIAKCLGIPLIIHEQNRIPGTTNSLLAKISPNKVLEAFPNSFSAKYNAVCTGNPLRKVFVNIPEKNYWQPEINRKLKIFVLGGSQGAKVLNDKIPVALSRMSDIEIKHQTGSAMQNEVANFYKSLNLQADVYAFIEDMFDIYQWADIIICRAGAMTVSEVAAMGLPAVFIPLLNAIDDHQTANAQFLVDAGAALLLKQTELDSDNLQNSINILRASLSKMGINAKNQARLDATRRIADICVAEVIK